MDITERLAGWTTDWDGSQMVDGEPPRDGLHCDVLREAAAEILRLRAELAAARDAALEEAAKYVELPLTLPIAHDMILDGDQCDALAAGIRALKATP